MFLQTKWLLEEFEDETKLDDSEALAYVGPAEGEGKADAKINEKYKLAITKRFDFTAKLARMSVITKNCLDGNFRCFVKGSPERLKELCLIETIPENYDEMLNGYAECGYRVLALA